MNNLFFTNEMVNVQEVFWARHCFGATGLAEGRFGRRWIESPSHGGKLLSLP